MNEEELKLIRKSLNRIEQQNKEIIGALAFIGIAISKPESALVESYLQRIRRFLFKSFNG